MDKRNPRQDVPDIPECDVEREGDGYRLKHHGTGEVEHADDLKHAEMKGSLLRVSAVYAREMLFRTGDPT